MRGKITCEGFIGVIMCAQDASVDKSAIDVFMGFEDFFHITTRVRRKFFLRFYSGHHVRVNVPLNEATLNRWKIKYIEFCESIKKGEEEADFLTNANKSNKRFKDTFFILLELFRKT